MSKLKPKASIISEFKGKIEGILVDDRDVYYTVLNILDHLSNKNISFTKPLHLISDLIEIMLPQSHRL